MVYRSELLRLDRALSAISLNVRLFCIRPASCSRLPLITYNSSSVSFPQLSLIFPLYSFKEPSTQFQFMPSSIYLDVIGRHRVTLHALEGEANIIILSL